jgi:outer membrane protein
MVPRARRDLPQKRGQQPPAAAALFILTLAAATVLRLVSPAEAETIEQALARAYTNNPQVNAQRAIVRQADEGVPQALSGYRPNVSANASLFNGQQTANRVRAAESQVTMARETLRVMEQSVLLAAAAIYMDVSRDSANLEVQQNNVRVLQRTLTDTRNRFAVGQVTDTDVAQSEAQLAAAEASLHGAESTLTTTRANYRRIIGVDPGNLAPASSVERMAPATLSAAIAAGAAENPSVIAALYGVDVAQLQVKIAEGALFPTLAAQYNVQYGVFPQLLTPHQFTDTVMLNLSVPIYQGGADIPRSVSTKSRLASSG